MAAIKILTALLLVTPGIIAQVYSDITYSTNTMIDVQTGADVCANDIFINGVFSGGGTICTGALPVSISVFSGSVDKRNVTLTWVTEWELNNSGFDIERRDTVKGTDWQKIAFVSGNGTSNVSHGYIYKDEKLPGSIYQYRLKQIDYNGNFEYFNLSGVIEIVLPKQYGIGQNYPNPSNPKSKIDYEIPIQGKVTIKLYNLLGQEIYRIVDEFREAGYYTAEFDGSQIASGVYFYRINAEGEDKKFTKTMKMIIVK
jgi:hypothetical protein